MKTNIPVPVVVGAIVAVLAVAVYFIWSSMQPLKSDAVLPDVGTMSAEQIAEMKSADHSADEARGRQ
jgi:hypothetical protein